ncbi:MAG: SDR family oxidoreductase [Pseudomonadota bacterium]
MKTMLITGASSGIGAETARHAVAAGYKVGLAARSAEKLTGLVEKLGTDNAIAITCDVTEWTDQQAMAATMLDAYGRIDVVFANAGLGATAAGTEAGEVENWKEMVLVNVYGAALTVKATFAALKETKGHLLLTGSRAGRGAIKGSVYGATKWAITGYGQNMREELAGTGCRVTLIEPGMVDTPFFDSPKPQGLKAEDVANAVMYAVSQPPHVDVSELLVLPVRSS